MATTTKPIKDKKRSADYTSSHILVIDDDVTITKVVELNLAKAGYEHTSSVNDSQTAMAVIQNTMPNMVLLDIFMPEVTGLEILKQIRANPNYNDIVVLMLSSAGKEEQFQSLEMGAMGFIQKPVTDVALIEEVGKAFRVASRFGAF